MGESSGSEISVFGSELESFSVDTPGGRIHIRWDYEARATPNAQLAFFAEFLTTPGLTGVGHDPEPRELRAGLADLPGRELVVNDPGPVERR